jgi:hypothetical protein
LDALVCNGEVSEAVALARLDVLFKHYFDVIGMILLIIEVVMVPFGLAWEDVGTRFSDVVSFISVGYWSFDVILSFFMPYERDSVNMSDCRMTSLHYVQRSFILDLLILSIEWISTVLSHTVPLQDCT